MVFLIDSSGLFSDTIEALYARIDSNFKDKSGRVLNVETKCGRLLLRYALSKYYSFDTFAVNSASDDKPYFEDIKLHFSISHSGKYVLLGISDEEIGCDVQIATKYKEAVARRFYSKNEYELLQYSDDKTSIFFKLWTLKESVLKYSGEGLGGGLDKYDFSHYVSLNEFFSWDLYFKTLKLTDAFVSVCSRRKQADVIYVCADELTEYLKTERRVIKK